MTTKVTYRNHIITVKPSTRQDGAPYFVTDVDGSWFGGAHVRQDRAIANAKAWVRRKFSPLNRTCKHCGTDYNDPGGHVDDPKRYCPNCGSKAWYAGPAISYQVQS
jgi:hypothetical protein